MATPAPDRIVAGRYLLRALLGRGGVGVVWQAYDALLRREVAVKEVVLPLLLPQTQGRSAQLRVLREARAAAQLHHRGAVRLHDVVQDHGHTFIVTELVRAPTLADLVHAQGPLPPRRVAEIGAQLADVLHAAHRAGIVHRDVKPSNVLVPEDGGVKLAGFGVASLHGDPQLTATGVLLGSPAYMAPEQARGRPSGPPADVWALGATMFFAVQGEPPFDEGALIPTLAAVVSRPPRPLRRAGQLERVIGALLTKDPAARPTAARVRAWLRPQVDAARPAQPPDARSAQGPGREPAAAAERPDRPVLPPAPPGRRDWGRLREVLAVLLAGGLLLLWLVGSIGTHPGTRRAVPATSWGVAGATATSQPAPSTTERPATTHGPTTATTATAPGGLPAGWRTFTNRAGSNRVGVPPGFQVHTRPSYHATVVQEQRDPGRVFTVRSTDPANPLPQASQAYRAWARRSFQDFREIRYAENQTYAGRTGAVVFEYEAVRDGRRVHVSHINVKGRTWGYNVELITPVDQWASSQPLARQFEQAFHPLG